MYTITIGICIILMQMQIIDRIQDNLLVLESGVVLSIDEITSNHANVNLEGAIFFNGAIFPNTALLENNRKLLKRIKEKK